MVDSSPYSTFKALLDSRKDRQVGVADTITFACSALSGTGPWTIAVECIVHGRNEIGGCSLKQWLPRNGLPELKAIQFEAVYPGNGQFDPRYRKHPVIKAFFDKTTLETPVDGKRLRVDYHGSSAEPERPHLEEANTWFLRVRVRFTGDRNFQHVLADRKDREDTSLKAASFIAYACSDISGHASQHPGTIHVEVLVHCKSGRNIKRGTLDGWLNCDEIEELECEPIRPGARKHHTTDPTVQRFYAETALQDDVAAGAGKRIRVIHLGTEEVKKAGRPKGSTTAAAAASAAASLPADAAAGAPATTPSPPGRAAGSAQSAATTEPPFTFAAPPGPAARGRGRGQRALTLSAAAAASASASIAAVSQFFFLLPRTAPIWLFL